MVNGQRDSPEQILAKDGKWREVLFPVFSVLEGAFVVNGKLGDWEHVGSPAWMLTNAWMLTRMQAKVKSRS